MRSNPAAEVIWMHRIQQQRASTGDTVSEVILPASLVRCCGNLANLRRTSSFRIFPDSPTAAEYVTRGGGVERCQPSTHGVPYKQFANLESAADSTV
jgi:hypothetical protein